MDLSIARDFLHGLIQDISITQAVALALALLSGLPVGWALYRPRSPR